MRRAVSATPSAGVGLRLPHLHEVAATRPGVSWFEIHPENFLASAHARELLDDIARDYPIAVHTVGVSVGSVRGVDRHHLARVASLIHALDPLFVSGHLAWSTHEGVYLNDLLPLPYTQESLDVVAQHLDEVQQVIGRPFVLENPSSYVGCAGSTMREPEFLNTLAHRTGCRLLCDVSNIVVSGANLHFEPAAYIEELDWSVVEELHLGGFTEEPDVGDPSASVLIDTHNTVVDERSWALYEQVLMRSGPRATLIEWDNDMPAFDTLLAEATRATHRLEACHATR